jgi:hypothetical protein
MFFCDLIFLILYVLHAGLDIHIKTSNTCTSIFIEPISWPGLNLQQHQWLPRQRPHHTDPVLQLLHGSRRVQQLHVGVLLLEGQQAGIETWSGRQPKQQQKNDNQNWKLRGGTSCLMHSAMLSDAE